MCRGGAVEHFSAGRMPSIFNIPQKLAVPLIETARNTFTDFQNCHLH